MEQRERSSDPYLTARDAFMTQRGLAFTCEWRRFPWTKGADVERALVGPAYLGNVCIGLRDGVWSWEDPRGGYRVVPRDDLTGLVEQVIETRAGFVPPLPRRG
ncbi:hypothetical protein NGM33_09225 [Nocardiopsis dassonvillei]|nr:hypothetical protein [Nocardiopsis dassonvillei]